MEATSDLDQALSGKRVVITGVGSGLGMALTKAFLAHGAIVAGLTRDLPRLHDHKDISESPGFSGYQVDVGSFTEVSSAIKDFSNRTGTPQIVFNNAAVYPRISFLDESAVQWERAIATNINGTANCCKAVLPYMIADGYGRIFNVGSFADIAPIPRSAAYSASKGAIRALTKAIAADLDRLALDIEVHEWIPGHMKTAMSEYTGHDPAISAVWGLQLAAQSKARRRSCIYENDHEWLPAKGIRQRIRERLFFWRQFD